jgi:hypothetical protein
MHLNDCKGCPLLVGCRFRKNKDILKNLECPCSTCLIKMKCINPCDRYDDFCEEFQRAFRGKINAQPIIFLQNGL